MDKHTEEKEKRRRQNGGIWQMHQLPTLRLGVISDAVFYITSARNPNTRFQVHRSINNNTITIELRIPATTIDSMCWKVF